VGSALGPFANFLQFDREEYLSKGPDGGRRAALDLHERVQAFVARKEGVDCDPAKVIITLFWCAHVEFLPPAPLPR
jgi:hypothetical protein